MRECFAEPTSKGLCSRYNGPQGGDVHSRAKMLGHLMLWRVKELPLAFAQIVLVCVQELANLQDKQD